jgi:hypothetical protein
MSELGPAQRRRGKSGRLTLMIITKSSQSIGFRDCHGIKTLDHKNQASPGYCANPPLATLICERKR